MRLGATRHGPSAPLACQFGKYDVFTRTGVPVRSTSKLMRSSLILMLVTAATGTATCGGVALAPWTRGQLDGPDAASSTGQRDASWYHGTTVLIQLCPPGASLYQGQTSCRSRLSRPAFVTPRITAGCSERPATGALSSTR